jgi:hypothetical protein
MDIDDDAFPAGGGIDEDEMPLPYQSSAARVSEALNGIYPQWIDRVLEECHIDQAPLHEIAVDETRVHAQVRAYAGFLLGFSRSLADSVCELHRKKIVRQGIESKVKVKRILVAFVVAVCHSYSWNKKRAEPPPAFRAFVLVHLYFFQRRLNAFREARVPHVFNMAQRDDLWSMVQELELAEPRPNRDVWTYRLKANPELTRAEQLFLGVSSETQCFWKRVAVLMEEEEDPLLASSSPPLETVAQFIQTAFVMDKFPATRHLPRALAHVLDQFREAATTFLLPVTSARVKNQDMSPSLFYKEYIITQTPYDRDEQWIHHLQRAVTPHHTLTEERAQRWLNHIRIAYMTPAKTIIDNSSFWMDPDELEKRGWSPTHYLLH